MMGRNIMVLWRWSEALACEGDASRQFNPIGSQLRTARRGDRLFVCATVADELYLLGLLKVQEILKERSAVLREQFGDWRARCRNLGGPFKILALGRHKSQLRFVNSQSDRLDPTIKLAMQVRAHRFLSEESAELLERLLGSGVAARERERRFIEGERRAAKMARSVRSAALRLAAKHRWGVRCYCCGFSFEEFYDSPGKDFAIIHHIAPFGKSDGDVRETSVEDVRIVCANCHYIIHRPEETLDVEMLKRRIARRWTNWTEGGIRTR
jgi:hypothetical protein